MVLGLEDHPQNPRGVGLLDKEAQVLSQPGSVPDGFKPDSPAGRRGTGCGPFLPGGDAPPGLLQVGLGHQDVAEGLGARKGRQPPAWSKWRWGEDELVHVPGVRPTWARAFGWGQSPGRGSRTGLAASPPGGRRGCVRCRRGRCPGWGGGSAPPRRGRRASPPGPGTGPAGVWESPCPPGAGCAPPWRQSMTPWPAQSRIWSMSWPKRRVAL